MSKTCTQDSWLPVGRSLKTEARQLGHRDTVCVRNVSPWSQHSASGDKKYKVDRVWMWLWGHF